MSQNKMKAAVYQSYGPARVLTYKDVPLPMPKAHEVLIKIKAVPVTAGDRRLRGLDIPFPLRKILFRLYLGWKKPRKPILGFYLTGRIVQLGASVTQWNMGDQVLARTMQQGAYGEYICLSEKALIVLKPANLNWEEAAAIPYGALNAMYFLKECGAGNSSSSKRKILIYGASGAIGSAAVQLARHYGYEVTAVCSTANIYPVKALGADRVLDYKKEDFKELKEKFSAVFDAVGKICKAESEHLLNEGGRFISVFSSKSQVKIEDFQLVKEFCESEILEPVIDRVYPLKNAAQAHEYADLGHVKGNVILRMTESSGIQSTYQNMKNENSRFFDAPFFGEFSIGLAF